MKKLLRKLIQAQTTSQKGELSAAKIISDEIAASAKRRHPCNDTFETQFSYKDEVHPR